ncbi:MAG: biosynthetic-type acetolactate synthase large subunit [bacterium]|nr:biosynthetic-type acetolactate synthase large subunit [bacterium]
MKESDELKNSSTPRKEASEKITGAQAIIASLEAEGVKLVFGYPGGQALEIYDAILDSKKIEHILVRHEQAAVHAADGYARATGDVGVVLVTSGPGATNTITGITNAFLDSIPLVVIAGQVPTSAIGTDAFQEADFAGITLPITKHGYLVTKASDLPKAFREAFHIARTGRPGPVVICVPSDVACEKLSFEYPKRANIASYKPTYKGNSRQVKQAAALIACASKPVIIAGGGVVSSGACEELKNLAEILQIPVACTLMARGAFPARHHLHLGQLGMHGMPWANMAVMESDLIIAVGTRFSDRITGDIERFAPGAKVIHIDIDPAEIGKNIPVDIPIVGDAGNVLGAIFHELQKSEPEPLTMGWLECIDEWKSTLEIEEPLKDNLIIHSKDIFDAINELTAEKDTIIVTEVGQHQMWAARFLEERGPRTFVTSGGLGAMGFGFPAAMGIALAKPESTVICIAGDGSIQMNIQEMATIAQYGLPVKVVVVDNGSLGMVKQMQELFYMGRYSAVDLPRIPDFKLLAQAYGWYGDEVSDPEKLKEALALLLECPGPGILDVRMSTLELALPMVAPDSPLNKMIGVEKAGRTSRKGRR